MLSDEKAVIQQQNIIQTNYVGNVKLKSPNKRPKRNTHD